MQGVSPAERTEFFKGQLVRGRLPVFTRRVIFSLTFITRKPYKLPHGFFLNSKLLDDFRHDPGSYRLAALTYGKPQAFFHGNRGNQRYLHVDIVSRHDHLRAFR
jgi:hypothetical protein